LTSGTYIRLESQCSPLLSMDHFGSDLSSKCLSERGSDRRDVQISEWSWFTSRAVTARRVGVIKAEAQSDATSCLSVNTGWKLCGFTEA
jgi:hypothetical protein